MSDQDNQPPKAPTVKTSAVPLKKETVRITLRPSAPPSEPLAPVAPPPPTAQVHTAPSAVPIAPPRPAMGAPTVPLRANPPAVRPGPPTVPVGGAPPPPATRPIGGSAMPPAPVGSKTIPLAQAPGPRPVTPAGSPTGRLPGSPATQPLPKATMKLTRTEPLAGGAPTAAISSAPIKSAQFEDDDDEEDNEGPLNMMSIIALVGAIAAVFVALLSWTKVTPFTVPEIKKGDESTWAANSNSKDWKIPGQYNPYSKANADETFTNNYSSIKKDSHTWRDRPEPKTP